MEKCLSTRRILHFKKRFISFSKGADLLLCECNFYGDMDGSSAGHMNSFDAGNLAAKAEARQSYVDPFAAIR